VTSLSFTVTFHSPFRVGSAYARDGVDAALDRHDPLPPDHIKGLMRAAASDLLGLRQAEVDEVFGSPAAPSPWSWSSAQPAGGDWEFSFRHRVAIDRDTHSARKDHLVLGEQAWTGQTRFSIHRTGALEDAARDRHVLILRCAAAAVHALGSWRRRGLGWVGVVPDGEPVSTGDIETLLSLAGRP
jgi:hypothetical protein